MIQKTDKPYFENLDGLRFLCFLFVFLYHSFHTEYAFIRENPFYQFLKFRLFAHGNLGVNFFFVLSGFLITYLLILEKESKHKINIGKFWVRRILRIWPLFFFCVFFGFIIFPFLKASLGGQPAETANPVYYLLFLNNFDVIKNGPPDSSVLSLLWTVAVEEQFYFVWPLLLSVLPIRGYPYLFAAIIAISIWFRARYPVPMLYEMHTLSCMGDMALGALGAWVILYTPVKTWIANLGRVYTGLLYITILLIFLFRTELAGINSFTQVIERPFIAFVFLLVILEQSFSTHSFFKMVNFKTITRLGVISYGLYCLHFIGILIVTNLTRMAGVNDSVFMVIVVETCLALGLTIAIAYLSYRYFEKPFLKWKDKFSVI